MQARAGVRVLVVGGRVVERGRLYVLCVWNLRALGTCWAAVQFTRCATDLACARTIGFACEPAGGLARRCGMGSKTVQLLSTASHLQWLNVVTETKQMCTVGITECVDGSSGRWRGVGRIIFYFYALV